MCNEATARVTVTYWTVCLQHACRSTAHTCKADEHHWLGHTAAASWMESWDRGHWPLPSSHTSQSADQWAFRRAADIIQWLLSAFHHSRSAWGPWMRDWSEGCAGGEAVGDSTPGYYQAQNKQCPTASSHSRRQSQFTRLLLRHGRMERCVGRVQPSRFTYGPPSMHPPGAQMKSVNLRRATGAEEHRVLQPTAMTIQAELSLHLPPLAVSTHPSA
jgi:hypothetical protein